MNKENEHIFKSYLSVISEQQQQDVKQKLAQQVQQPEAQQAMLQQAQELQKKYQAEIAAALEKDGGTPGANVDALLKKIQEELASSAKQQVKESIELEEGFFGRTASLASGAIKKAGDVMSGKTSNLGFRQEAILKHFEKLKHNLGSQLRELQRDMETTSGVDTKVRDAVNKTIANIEAKHNIAPVSSKFSDFRHKAGKFVQNIATGALIAAPVMAAAAPIAAAVGLTGAGAAAAAAGLTGGSVSMLKDLINGQKPDGKRAAIAAVGAAVTAGLMSKLTAAQPQADAPEVEISKPAVDTHANNAAIEVDDFQTQHGTSYNPASEMDKAAVDMRASVRDAGMSEYGSTFGAKQIMKDLTDDFAKHARQLGVPHKQMASIVNDVTKNLSPEQLAQLTDDKALRTGKAAIDFAKIIADKHPELGKRGIEKIAQNFVKRWH